VPAVHPSRRPFRFAASTHGVADPTGWRELARSVEDLGYATLHVSDHVRDGLAALPALAVAAEATTTLRVGPLVLANDLRNPVVAAKELATIDVLSGGRLEWGMGAGWVPRDFEATGIPMDPGRERVARLVTSIARMQAWFAEGEPPPVQRPHPPLLVGGAQRGVLSLAAREADVVGIGPSLLARSIFGGPPECSPTEALDRQVGWLEAAAPERIEVVERHVVAFPAVVTDDARGRAASVGETLDWTVDDVLSAPHVLIGSVDALCDALVERRERWGISYVTVQAAAARAFAPVVARLAGR
jgi:probable F420-dependent oxidoreductase